MLFTFLCKVGVFLLRPLVSLHDSLGGSQPSARGRRSSDKDKRKISPRRVAPTVPKDQKKGNRTSIKQGEAASMTSEPKSGNGHSQSWTAAQDRLMRELVLSGERRWTSIAKAVTAVGPSRTRDATAAKWRREEENWRKSGLLPGLPPTATLAFQRSASNSALAQPQEETESDIPSSSDESESDDDFPLEVFVASTSASKKRSSAAGKKNAKKPRKRVRR
ncbi:hypothetical protein JCM10213_002298 [Rhodosporidiobolus nylandii]